MTTSSKIPDGGWGWIVVAAAAIISAIADGATFSFGLLFIEFLKEFELSKASTSWIGSLFLAVPLLTGTIMSALVDRYGCRLMTMVGGLISTLGFILSAYVRDIRVMYLTFGVMTGLGLGLCYVTLVVSVAFWFEKKRSLAVSLGSCGTGIGTFVYAPLTQYLINEYGWRGTTIFLAGGFLNICVCGALMRDPDWIVEQNEKEEEEKRKLMENAGEAKKNVVQNSEGVVGRCFSVVHLPTFMRSHSNVPIEALQPSNGTIEKHPRSDKVLNISKTKGLQQEKPFPRVESFPWLRHHHGYLRNMRFRRGSSVHRGAILNIHRYKLKASSCPDIYRNSMISLSKEAEEKWYYETLQLLKSMADFSFLKELHFLLFFLSSILLFMWIVVPYFYLAEHLISNGYSETDTSLVLSTIGITNTIGIIILGWAGDQPWLNITKTYTISLILCGCSVAGMIIFTNSIIMEFTCAALFGLFFASNLSFTPGILVEIVPLERFTIAYGLILMSQGIGHLVGPPLGGLLNDLTSNWEQAFWQAGLWIVVSGVLVGLIPFVKNRKIVGKGPVAKVLASEKGGII